MEGGAYGAGRAGAPFSLVAFLKQPQVILRLVAVVFCMLVFGPLLSRGHSPTIANVCLLGFDENACNYGTVVPIFAMLNAIGFLLLDAFFCKLSSVQHRKYAVIADIACSGLWAFLYFVGFCYMADKWRTTNKAALRVLGTEGYGINDVQTAIAFSFFSTCVWIALFVLAIMRYRKGVAEDFGALDDRAQPDIAQSSNPYTSFGGGEMDQSYQQAPFSGNGAQAKSPSSEYTPPTY